ncbi:GFA family protein [Methylomonas sp. UP202]|uniref:GFA family protein n=1 Tax=Methylomonas sp. UP202 TaxID=3040943 RepID=UPI0024785C1F|nr:GFA family protein [Methylomonas sp. UP202]WGS84655.1 GFA family protein [Methylomonas sp. UP202]
MSEVTLNGGCLCGAVQFQVRGEPQRFYHCHCRRCRKASGTGHASNLIIGDATLSFTQGEVLLKRYKVPDAQRFARQFCSECGAAVARFVPELNGVVIPAGALDDAAPIQPQARIFWDSRADWSCDGDDLPRYAEYPV